MPAAGCFLILNTLAECLPEKNIILRSWAELYEPQWMTEEREKHSGKDAHSEGVKKVREEHTAIRMSAQLWWKLSTGCSG